jgi:hypothetical protein
MTRTFPAIANNRKVVLIGTVMSYKRRRFAIDYK